MTTTTLGMPAVAPISIGRLLYAYLNEARYESLRMLRAPAFAIPFLVLPLAIYLLFGVAMAGPAVEKNPRVADYLFIGFSVMAVMGPAMFGMGITLAAERDAGLLKLKRAMPVPPGAYLLSKMLMSLFFATVAMALMIATAVFAGHLTLSPARLAAISAVLIVGSVPFCALGMFIGTWCSGGAAPAIINLIYLPMIWLSGLFIPLPGFLQKLVVIWPAFHLGQVAVAAGDVTGFLFMPAQMSAGVLLGITILFGGAAIRRLARTG